MEFAEYEHQVKQKLYSIQDWGHEVWKKAAQDVVPDLEAGPPYIRQPFAKGFSVRDAALSILLTADTWDEDWAIAEQEKLSKKYRGEQ